MNYQGVGILLLLVGYIAFATMEYLGFRSVVIGGLITMMIGLIVLSIGLRGMPPTTKK